MSRQVRYTLVADGSSDRMLLPLVAWTLGQISVLQNCRLVPQFAEPAVLRLEVPGLAGKITAVERQYPCDLLFVHRDGESESREKRLEEIHDAMSSFPHLPFVCLVPVRMSEAWLLIDADAIKRAADNPSSQSNIGLPRLRELEQLPDPKQVLRKLLVEASELRGRRKDRFQRDLAWRCQRVAELIRDFSDLFQLTAFAAFQQETLQVVEKLFAEQKL
jgi:hypothetical protein